MEVPGPRGQQVPLASAERIIGPVTQQGTKSAGRCVVAVRVGMPGPELGDLPSTT